VVKQVIKEVLAEHLTDKEYNQNDTGVWTREIAAAIKLRLKELNLPVSHVVRA
jgi:hypothetical protein